FWSVGLVTLVVCVWRFWVADYMFGIFVLLAGVCLILLGGSKPEEIDVVIDEEGAVIGHNQYLWSNVSGYAIVVSGGKPVLLLDTNRKIVPVVDINIPENVSIDLLDTVVSKYVPQKDLNPSNSKAILKMFGF
ncbi:MAG: hypothetical protein ACR2IQ_01440, partial [Minisyncoccia bacterium]